METVQGSDIERLQQGLANLLTAHSNLTAEGLDFAGFMKRLAKDTVFAYRVVSLVLTLDQSLVIRPGAPVGLSMQDIGLSDRVRNLLGRNGIKDLSTLLTQSDRDLLRISGFGESSLSEVVYSLADYGLSLAPSNH